MSRRRFRLVWAAWALPLVVALVAAGGGCSGQQGDAVFEQGGEGTNGGSASQSGTSAAGGTAGSPGQAGSAAGGSALAGASVGGSSAGGTSAGGTSAGGTNAGAGGDAGSPGQSGAPTGGTSSSSCDEGCVEICEGGAGCMCSCPTTSLKCPSTVEPKETSFPSGCKVDDDCFGAEHYTGCCRVMVVGLNVSQREGFTKWEKDTCHNPPVCDCAIDTLTTDDGKMIRREMRYAVRCLGGKCATSAP